MTDTIYIKQRTQNRTLTIHSKGVDQTYQTRGCLCEPVNVAANEPQHSPMTNYSCSFLCSEFTSSHTILFFTNKQGMF